MTMISKETISEVEIKTTMSPEEIEDLFGDNLKMYIHERKIPFELIAPTLERYIKKWGLDKDESRPTFVKVL